MATRDIIVVGASAGGVEALQTLARGLPEDLPAAVCVVLHLPAHVTSSLPHILSRAGPLPACHACDGEAIQHGRIYVAPPDHHLLVRRDTILVRRGPRENGHRPGIDPLFRSAAHAYGTRVIAVLLSGLLSDGSAGLAAVKERGGLALVQDPADALYASMPRNGMAAVAVDHVLPAARLPAVLTRLVQEPVEEKGGEPVSAEPDLQPDDMRHERQERRAASSFTCPECHGALWEMENGDLVGYRCRVGHAYSVDNLLIGQSDMIEVALWEALRALEEKAALSRRLAARMAGHGNQASRHFQQQAHDADERAGLIRQVLARDEVFATEGLTPGEPSNGSGRPRSHSESGAG